MIILLKEIIKYEFIFIIKKSFTVIEILVLTRINLSKVKILK